MRKAGNRLRITAQLIDAETGAHVWAERFDREMEDIFDPQDEITERIVTAIAPEMLRAEEQRALRKRPADLGAWDLCHRSLWHIYRYSKEDNTTAQEYLERAMSLDTNWALPHTWVAFRHVTDALLSYSADPAVSLKLSGEAAETAVRLDGQDPMARGTLSIANIFLDRQRAISEGEKAIALNPSLSYGYMGLGSAHGFLGHWEECLDPIQTANRLSPRDPLLTFMLTVEALAHLMLKDFDTAADCAERGLREQPNNVRGHIRLSCALAHKGDLDAARAAYLRSKISYRTSPSLISTPPTRSTGPKTANSTSTACAKPAGKARWQWPRTASNAALPRSSRPMLSAGRASWGRIRPARLRPSRRTARN